MTLYLDDEWFQIGWNVSNKDWRLGYEALPALASFLTASLLWAWKSEHIVIVSLNSSYCLRRSTSQKHSNSIKALMPLNEVNDEIKSLSFCVCSGDGMAEKHLSIYQPDGLSYRCLLRAWLAPLLSVIVGVICCKVEALCRPELSAPTRWSSADVFSAKESWEKKKKQVEGRSLMKTDDCRDCAGTRVGDGTQQLARFLGCVYCCLFWRGTLVFPFGFEIGN